MTRGFAPASAALAAAALLLAACAPKDAGEQESRHRFMAMGTLVEITTWGAPPDEAAEAARAVEQLFGALQLEWDPWGEGALGELNRALAAGEPAEADAELQALLAQATRLQLDSGGRFDPGLGSLVRLWGFNSADSVPAEPPPAEQIAALLAGDAPLQIDLGGFLKGVAVDRAVALLRERGIEHAIVNAGGDLRAIGRRGERPWRIGVRAPRDNRVLAAIEVDGDEAVFTSGDYERYFEYRGRRFHHILDPRSGYPTEGITSATVLHPDGGLADAAATALMVAGPEDWPAVAAELGVTAVMVVLADGSIELTEAMRPRAWFPDEAEGRDARLRALP
jgi:FAD:protein FMN transferase